MAEYIKNPTPEDIEAWKVKYGKVHGLKFEAEFEEQPVKDEKGKIKLDPDGKEILEMVEVYPETIAYLRPPNRKDLSYAQSAKQTGGDLKFNEALLNNCFIGGDEIVKTKDSYFLGAGPWLAAIIEVKTCELVKL